MLADQRPATSDQRPATSDQRPATSDQRPATSDQPDTDHFFAAWITFLNLAVTGNAAEIRLLITLGNRDIHFFYERLGKIAFQPIERSSYDGRYPDT